METSLKGIKFIENEEWCVLHSYEDDAGVWTIGWGSTMYKTGKRVGPNEHVTQQEADDLLKWEISNKEKVVAAHTAGIKLNQNQFDALSSFTYNCGVGALAGSTLLRTVKRNPFDPYIRDCFAMWNKITVHGKKLVSPGLTARRRREADLYFAPMA
jgi:lysozyme